MGSQSRGKGWRTPATGAVTVLPPQLCTHLPPHSSQHPALQTPDPWQPCQGTRNLNIYYLLIKTNRTQPKKSKSRLIFQVSRCRKYQTFGSKTTANTYLISSFYYLVIYVCDSHHHDNFNSKKSSHYPSNYIKLNIRAGKEKTWALKHAEERINWNKNNQQHKQPQW